MTIEEMQKQLDAEKAKNQELAAKNAEFSGKLSDQEKTIQTMGQATKSQGETLMRLEFERKADKLVMEGKMLPADRESTIQTWVEASGTKVNFEGKEISLGEKMVLLMERSTPKVTVNSPAGRGNTDQPGTVVQVKELDALKTAYFSGNITATQYREQVDAWLKKATDVSGKGGTVQLAGRVQNVTTL